MVRPSGDSIYLKYSQEVTWNSHLSVWEKSLLVQSLRSTSEHEVCARNIVRIDEDAVQIYDDNDVDHIHENDVHKSLKEAGALVSPSGITDHLKEP